MLTKQVLLRTSFGLWGFLQFSGCSLIGFGIGAAVDGISPDEYVFTPSGVDSLKRGSTVQVLKIDSSIVTGDFERTGFAASENYLEMYKTSLNSLPMGNLMPAIGDSILIVTHGTLGRGTHTGQFLGFGDGVLHVQLTGFREPARVILEAVDTLSTNANHLVPGDLLRQYLGTGQLPILRKGLLLSSAERTIVVPIDCITLIRQPNPKKVKYAGLIVGGVLDLAVLVDIAVNGIKFGPFTR